MDYNVFNNASSVLHNAMGFLSDDWVPFEVRKDFSHKGFNCCFFSLSLSPIYTTKHLFITDVNKSGNDFNQGHNGIIWIGATRPHVFSCFIQEIPGTLV